MQQIAVITGVGSGIGKATAELLMELGYNVIGIDLGYSMEWDVGKFKNFFRNYGGSSMLRVHVDVVDEHQILKFWTRLEASLNKGTDKIDQSVKLLVNCAGISLMQWSEYISYEEFRKVLDVNLLGSFGMSTGFFRAFYGADNHDEQTIDPNQPIRRVINLGSLGSKQFFRGGTAYVCSKAAVEAMTRVMAKEHQNHNFKFFCVQPETLEGESQIAGYIKQRLRETRGKKESKFYGVGEINSVEEAEGYFHGQRPQTIDDIAKLIVTISMGNLDPLNGSALECLDGKS